MLGPRDVGRYIGTATLKGKVRLSLGCTEREGEGRRRGEEGGRGRSRRQQARTATNGAPPRTGPAEAGPSTTSRNAQTEDHGERRGDPQQQEAAGERQEPDEKDKECGRVLIQ